MYEQVLLQAGVAGVLVVAWFFSSKNSMQAFTMILSKQQEQEKNTINMIARLLENYEKQTTQQYNTLQEMVATTQHLIGQMSDIKHLIATNQFCPTVRNDKNTRGTQ